MMHVEHYLIMPFHTNLLMLCLICNIGMTSKTNQRFFPASIVVNNDNCPEPDGTAGHLTVGL